MPTEYPANITETCQCVHHDQLLVPNVEGTNICNMAPSLAADEVAGASSANSFCPQVPKMFHDTDFVLKLLILKAWSIGAEPGSSKRARSWNPCRIIHLLEHVSVILLIKYICLDHLVDKKSLLCSRGCSLKTDSCKTHPAIIHTFPCLTDENNPVQAEIHATWVQPSCWQSPIPG